MTPHFHIRANLAPGFQLLRQGSSHLCPEAGSRDKSPSKPSSLSFPRKKSSACLAKDKAVFVLSILCMRVGACPAYGEKRVPVEVPRYPYSRSLATGIALEKGYLWWFWGMGHRCWVRCTIARRAVWGDGEVFVGVDVSKKRLDVRVWSGEGGVFILGEE